MPDISGWYDIIMSENDNLDCIILGDLRSCIENKPSLTVHWEYLQVEFPKGGVLSVSALQAHK
jgi:hypothetical protein